MMDGYAADIARYTEGGMLAKIRTVVQSQGLWALGAYRLLHPLVKSPRWVVRKPASVVALLAMKFMEITTGIMLPVKAEIGPGLYLPHHGTIIINRCAVIGSNVTLMHDTTLGNSGRWDSIDDQAPTLGDRVYLGAGACVLGKVHIGDDATIGANAAVTKSLPARAVAVGNPARIVSMRGSFRYTAYPGMFDDPARRASLAIAESGTEPIPDDPTFTRRAEPSP